MRAQVHQDLTVLCICGNLLRSVLRVLQKVTHFKKCQYIQYNHYPTISIRKPLLFFLIPTCLLWTRDNRYGLGKREEMQSLALLDYSRLALEKKNKALTAESTSCGDVSCVQRWMPYRIRVPFWIILV